MSYYHRYGQGAATPVENWEVTVDNIDDMLKLCVSMNTLVRKVKLVSSLMHKQEHPERFLEDKLWTPEYVARRLEGASQALSEHGDETVVVSEETKQRLVELELLRLDTDEQASAMFASIIQRDTITKDESDHMDVLNDARQAAEDDNMDAWKELFPELHKNLSKIFTMILEGIDFGTIEMCFQQYKLKLQGKTTDQQARRFMGKAAIDKYKLPANMFDHLDAATMQHNGMQQQQGKGKGKKNRNKNKNKDKAKDC